MKKITLVCLLALVGCGIELPASETAETESDSSTRSFEVGVKKEGFSLTNALSVVRLTGGLTNCDHAWEIEGASGTVLAPAECQEPVIYETATIAVDGEEMELSFDGNGVTDAAGNQWRFDNQGGLPTIASEFSYESDAGATVERSRFGIEVALAAGDGAICDHQNPFTVAEAKFGQVVVSLNAPAGGFPTGIELSAEQGAVEVDEATLSFAIDSLMLAAGEHVFTNLKASLGNSECNLTRLTLTVIENGDGGGDDPEPTLENFFSKLVFEGPNRMAENAEALAILEAIVAEDGQRVPPMLAQLLRGEAMLNEQPVAYQPYPSQNYYYSNGADISHVLNGPHSMVSIGRAEISHVHTSAALLVKGDVDIAHATRGPCFIIATGNVEVSFAKNCFIVAKGFVDISFNTDSYVLSLTD